MKQAHHIISHTSWLTLAQNGNRFVMVSRPPIRSAAIFGQNSLINRPADVTSSPQLFTPPLLWG
jgi:hypothetical protein